MALDRSNRRLALRHILTDAEKRIRDLSEKISKELCTSAAALRDLSRPARKRSAYPTLVALQDALEQVIQIHDETAEMIELLTHGLDEARDLAAGGRFNER